MEPTSFSEPMNILIPLFCVFAVLPKIINTKISTNPDQPAIKVQ